MPERSNLTDPHVLPIDQVLPELKHSLEQTTTALLQAPPGAGKTTRVPRPCWMQAGDRGAKS